MSEEPKLLNDILQMSKLALVVWGCQTSYERFPGVFTGRVGFLVDFKPLVN
jgi:hypothetical protein